MQTKVHDVLAFDGRSMEVIVFVVASFAVASDYGFEDGVGE